MLWSYLPQTQNGIKRSLRNLRVEKYWWLKQAPLQPPSPAADIDGGHIHANILNVVFLLPLTLSPFHFFPPLVSNCICASGINQKSERLWEAHFWGPIPCCKTTVFVEDWTSTWAESGGDNMWWAGCLVVLVKWSPGLIQIPRLGQAMVVTFNHKGSTRTMMYLITLSVSNVSIPEAKN